MKIPEGWKLVPSEPTKEMADEAWKYGNEKTSDAPDPVYAYKAMLAAAPTPPAQDEVKIPSSADEAELMLKLGWMWLASNAPEKLKTPAQDEPVAVSINGKLANLREPLPHGTELYTRPQSDKLRQAAEEVIDRFYNGKCDGELEECVINLRYALEGK